MKNLVYHMIIGTVGGVCLALLFVLGLIVVRNSFWRPFLEVPFSWVGKGLDFGPWAGLMKRRQDPLWTLAAILVYWGALGAAAGSLLFVIRRVISKRKGD